MSCYQCSQASKNLGCHVVGICGKTPTVAGLQDLIIHYSKIVSKFALSDKKLWHEALFDWFLDAIFMTLTNVNFDKDKHVTMLEKGHIIKEELKTLGAKSDEDFEFKNDIDYLMKEARKVGLLYRKKDINADLFGLIEMCTYGMKGCCAYFDHAEKLRK